MFSSAIERAVVSLIRLIISAPSSDPIISCDSFRASVCALNSRFLTPSITTSPSRALHTCNACRTRDRSIRLPSSDSIAAFNRGQPPATSPARFSTKLSIIFFSWSTQSETSFTPSSLPLRAFSQA